MSWSNVKQFSLQHDLAPLNAALAERGIPHRIVELSGAQVLQVPQAELVEPVSEFIQAWEEGRVPSKPSSDSASVAQTPPERQEFWQSLVRAPVTVALILASIFGFACVEFAPLRAFVAQLTFVPVIPTQQGLILGSLQDTIQSQQFWRLLSPALLHFSIFHIVFNALWTWELGRRLEWSMGPGLYVVFFVITGVASNLAQYFWPGPQSLFGGMSGVIYAMVGYIGICQWLKPEPLLAVPKGILIFMLAWLGICMLGVVDFFMAGGVANGAHLGGLISGAVFALGKLGLAGKTENVL
ncbi:rhomboid family intramembrane serine protease [Gilvimarinus sp. DA14]|uniref:rhomboid family intramembrane serine protease n=1 Tax=Gilvimarinus sp. DA14 TaxID=2956798 RepID=UPI0020B77B4B|nr:rhomboid family intramembrane serine protease [Gilvimarinus sp. DA14]UTF60713.1 rhomboid family intramembrane serine protease [Gilvimarinus sp. DA14]